MKGKPKIAATVFETSQTTKATAETVGASLLQFAEQAEFTAQRGTVSDLFPFIYQASKRMSTRAIARWLQEAHNIKLSVVTIARALREPDRYWVELYETIRPAARELASAFDMEDEYRELLLSKSKFESLKVQKYEPVARDEEEAFEKHLAYRDVLRTLEEKWFVLDEDTRLTCLKHAHRALAGELKKSR